MEIIDKLWGHEEILANDAFCFKRLVVNKGWRVSYHHHKLKDELFYLESGSITLTINGVTQQLAPRQWRRVLPGNWHSFTALEDSVILEASTHDDPADSYRDSSRLSGRMVAV
jgi:quercetin dioxygenase-like cupin family protein